ncbi:MAG: peptide-methionine (R)-S-oxide reductase MsrB [Bacteroidota bacterium]
MRKKYTVEKTDKEWKTQLSPEEYRVLRQKGTEYPHTGQYNLHFENGNYHCKACGAVLFESEHKFESGCGWPSFDQAVEGAIEYLRDTSHGMIRTETLCANCGSHLGHVFNDGPKETTGQRYCINSMSIGFDPSNQK